MVKKMQKGISRSKPTAGEKSTLPTLGAAKPEPSVSTRVHEVVEALEQARAKIQRIEAAPGSAGAQLQREVLDLLGKAIGELERM